MTPIEVFVGLLIATIPLVGLARHWRVQYPIVLVLGGIVLGFVPWLPPIELDPDLVLLIFLPPLLYWESITAPTDEMRLNARWIWPLAIGLVFATTAAVAGVAHALVPQMSWMAAFVLGAIVAPTDELAAVPIASRLGVPRHVIAVIEGESLLNDAASLVLYATGVAAIVTGIFSWQRASLQIVVAAVGAVAIGLIAARLAVLAWQHYTESRLQAVVSVVLPFVAYVPAQQLGLSGVLAVVTAGVYVNRRTPVVLTPAARVQLVGWWETTVFLANAIMFILVGLSLHSVTAAALAHHHSWPQLLGVALAVNVVILAVRFAWVFGQGAIPLFAQTEAHPGADWKHLMVTALCGMRGAVSLAAALALPQLVLGGRGFPERDLIIFVTFSVILVTLVGLGLALPALIRAVHVQPDDTEEAEVRRGLLAATQAALRRLDELERAGRVEPEHARALREEYGARLRRFSNPSPAEEVRAIRRYRVERELIEVQRATLVEMRLRGQIENEVLRRLQLTLDLAESEIDRIVGDPEDVADEDSELGTSPPALADQTATSPPDSRGRPAAS